LVGLGWFQRALPVKEGFQEAANLRGKPRGIDFLSLGPFSRESGDGEGREIGGLNEDGKKAA